MRNWTTVFQQILSSAFELQKQKNNRTSLRQFALRCGLPAGAVSEILNGKRALSRERAREVIENLGLPPQEHTRILALMGLAVEIERSAVRPDQSLVLSNWIDHAILAFFERPDLAARPEFIAERIGIEMPDLERRVQSLESRGFLKKGPDNLYHRLPEAWDARNVPDDEKMAHRLEHLRLTEHALRHGNKNEMRFAALTFHGTTAQLDEFYEEVRKMLDRIWAVSLDGPKEELMRIAIQGLPLNFRPAPRDRAE